MLAQSQRPAIFCTVIEEIHTTLAPENIFGSDVQFRHFVALKIWRKSICIFKPP